MLILLDFSDNCLQEVKSTVVHSEIPLSRNPQHAETSQLVYRENQLAGFYTTQASSERYFRTDHDLVNLIKAFLRVMHDYFRTHQG